MRIQSDRNIITTMLLVLTALTMLAAGCYYDKDELLYPDSSADCSKVQGTFTKVHAITAAKCATAGCHNAAAAGGTILESYSQISAAATRINQRAVIEKTMPPAAPLSAEEIAVIKCWISSGTPNN